MSPHDVTDECDHHIGILDIEVYIPRMFVSQQELERYDGVSEGKYTVGLQQEALAFVDQSDEGGEDTVSMALTCLKFLLDRFQSAGHNLDRIGRIEVGTETPIDKAKSIKSHLMQILVDEKRKNAKHGNNSGVGSLSFNVEGCDTMNACYGGTNALFSAVYFLESYYARQRRRKRHLAQQQLKSNGNGKSVSSSILPMYAIVVCTDIAQYALDGTSARATGGAGACAMLIGADAPLVIDLDLKCSFSQHSYDFWKGDPTVPYPEVEGHLSNMCYLKALDKCYKQLRSVHKELQQYDPEERGKELNLDYFDYLVFHTPYNKLVQKALGRLLYNDLVVKRKKNDRDQDEEYRSLENLLTELESEVDFGVDKIREFLSLSRRETYYNSELHKTFRKLSKQHFQTKVAPSVLLSKQLGNTYTASLYMALASLIYQRGNPEHGLQNGRKILMYSYGSGFCSSMFVIRTRTPSGNDNDAGSAFTIEKIKNHLQLNERLAMRYKALPAQLEAVQHNNLLFYRRNNFEVDPQRAEPKLFPGTYYLKGIDNRWRRTYTRKPCTGDNTLRSRL